jgi:hypothetical protein
VGWREAGVFCLAAIGCASPAAAQGTYVGASLTGDIVRFSRSETRGARDVSDGGEAIGFALRVGTPLGATWGVEAEFARPSEIENEGAPDVFPAAYRSVINVGLVVPDITPVIYPPISYRVRMSTRTTTFSTGLWAKQDLSARVALVYSGGAAFNRTEREVEYSYGAIPLPRLAQIEAILPPSSLTEAIHYSVRPFVGIGARIGMTEHLELVPAARLHGIESGVLIRPSVGLGWTF